MGVLILPVTLRPYSYDSRYGVVFKQVADDERLLSDSLELASKYFVADIPKPPLILFVNSQCAQNRREVSARATLKQFSPLGERH